MISYSIEEINESLKGTLEGHTNAQISGPEQIDKAQTGQITFIGNRKFAKLWPESHASAAIVNENIKIDVGDGRAVIRVKNADLAMARVLEMFAPDSPHFETDIHPNATIDSTVKFGKGCRIGAGCYVGKNVTLGDGVTLYANVTVMDETTIGPHCTLWPGTVIRERCVIGAHCTFHNNVSIGADGFGYRPADDGRGLVKIPQIGNVVIGNYVEIGSNSCVDRGKFSSTVIGDGCKIDNLVQIGHNSQMGRFCIMAGASGLAGSVTLGDGVIIGGSASIKDHTTIGDGAVVGAGSGVLSNIEAGQKVLGYPAVEYRDALKQWVHLRNVIKEEK
jgi:UDP-3-O-[3-hydroxymyristoyl] glucosamine N-acyltransferase